MVKKRAEPVDVHVGSRVRLRRTLLGFSQDKLGKALKLTFQQIQKYERGANRIGSSRLYQLSKILDVPVSFFFDQMPPEIAGGHAVLAGSTDIKSVDDHLSRRETLELVRAYYKITDNTVRKKLFLMIKSLGKSYSDMKNPDGVDGDNDDESSE